MDYAKLALYLARAIALLTAIPFHEAAHAWASDKLGDPTAKLYGRMSLNPVRHFDLLGALCMILVGFGWAKPVPVAARTNFKHPRRDMALSAAAGPLANVLLAAVDVYKRQEKILLKKGEGKTLTAETTLPQQMEAPVQKGEKVGEVTLKTEQSVIGTYPVTAAGDVSKMDFSTAFSLLSHAIFTL